MCSSTLEQDVTPTQSVEVGDIVSWRSARGFKTGGQVVALLDARVARVSTLAGRHPAFGLVTVGIDKLTKENPL